VVLHGNPTWSFLYRNIIKELCGQFRCIAPDYPGFGLSVAPLGHGLTPAEHAAVIEGFVQQLDPGTQAFSRILGSLLGRYLIERHNFFAETILPVGVRKAHLSDEVMNAYRGLVTASAERCCGRTRSRSSDRAAGSA
jgi:haloalkane dehalogenase